MTIAITINEYSSYIDYSKNIDNSRYNQNNLESICTDEFLSKIKEYKPCKNIDENRAKKEYYEIIETLNNPFLWMNPKYHPHKVKIEKYEYIALDAKCLNKHTNQAGRGNLRYLFDISSKEFIGLFYEKDSGKYFQIH
jgi:hypothetical protein